MGNKHAHQRFPSEPTMGSILKGHVDAHTMYKATIMDNRANNIITSIKHVIDGGKYYPLAGKYNSLTDAAKDGCTSITLHWGRIKKLSFDENILVHERVKKIVSDNLSEYNGITLTSETVRNKLEVTLSW